MAVLVTVQRNAKISKIPTPSLTGATWVFSSQIRRKLEFSSIISYNEFDKLFGYNESYLKCRKG